MNDLPERNNFDFIRIMAAVVVLVSHSYDFFHRSPEFFRALAWHDSAGGVAVKVFFFVSGFLVTGSLLQKPDLVRYLIARFLRIVPGLFVVVLFCVFVIGPLFTALTLKDYFTSDETYAYLKTVFVFPIQWQLPGVFNVEPFPRSINGSLWTLPFEASLYLLLPLLYFAGVLRRYFVAGLAGAFLIALMLGVYVFGLDHSHRGPNIMTIHLYDFLVFGSIFFFGSAFYLHRDLIKVDIRLALIVLGLFVLTFRTPVFLLGEVIALPYLTYCIAFSRWDLCHVTRWTGDISYGFYIYAFPVQRGVYDIAGGTLGFWTMVAIAAAITFGLAYLSRVLVERHALTLKRWFDRRKPEQPLIPLGLAEYQPGARGIGKSADIGHSK